KEKESPWGSVNHRRHEPRGATSEPKHSIWGDWSSRGSHPLRRSKPYDVMFHKCTNRYLVIIVVLVKARMSIPQGILVEYYSFLIYKLIEIDENFNLR